MKRPAVLAFLLLALPGVASAQIVCGGVTSAGSCGGGGGGTTEITSGTTVITGGGDTQLCYNDTGEIACGDAGLVYNDTTDVLTVTNIGQTTFAAAPIAATSIDIGTAAAPFRNLYLYGSGTFSTTSFQITGTPTGARVVTLPNASFTVVGLSLTQTWTGSNTFATASDQIIIGAVGGIRFTAGAGGALFQNQAPLQFGTSSAVRMVFQSNDTPDTMKITTPATSNAWVLVEEADQAGDYAHPLQTNPTLYINSATAAATSTAQWVGFAHDQTNGVISTGLGAVKLSPANGALIVTGTAPTVSSCGTSPSTVTGSATAGSVTWGSGASDASCTLTFVPALAVAPRCMAQNDTNILTVRAVASTTTIELDVAVAASVDSDVVSYICVGGS